MNIFITGANRGIGLGFVKHYLAKGHHVWASYRDNPATLEALNNPNCYPIEWDVIKPLSSGERTKLPKQINLLINNAGIYGDRDDGQSLSNVTQSQLLDVFNVDAASPIYVVQALLGQLKAGQAVIANMSSKMGSSTDNTSGGVYAYRAAKAALCNITKSMAVDLENHKIQVICLHPGWVQTDMTQNTGLIDVKTSVAGLASVIDNIKQYPPGAFVAFDGAIVPY